MTAVIEKFSAAPIAPVHELQPQVLDEQVNGETLHSPAAPKFGNLPKPKGVALDTPQDILNMTDVDQIKGRLDCDMDIAIAVMRCNQVLRMLGITLRDIENSASIQAQLEQVAQLRNGASLTIALSVVSGVMAVASAVVGGIGLKKNAVDIKTEKGLEKSVASTKAMIGELGKDDVAVHGLTKDMELDVAHLKTLTRNIDVRSMKTQLIQGVTKSLGDMSNAAIESQKSWAQSQAKAHEVDASIAQAQKQRLIDQVKNAEDVISQMIQILRDLTNNNNQAMRSVGTTI